MVYKTKHNGFGVVYGLLTARRLSAAHSFEAMLIGDYAARWLDFDEGDPNLKKEGVCHFSIICVPIAAMYRKFWCFRRRAALFARNVAAAA
ncbi:hypothetical protein DESC_480189 [Desulfosarcina cetonica]|uniref:hypothetical protein n=1 Tax=Desulfosarcina cetonica TaxID=90730 RepID=UPI00155DB950|nr:hypothetical protein [Desulfosarcina cetonica]VTR66479.1 hypothetical protein DESC_480189 [Desulfosarcina cetonica]